MTSVLDVTSFVSDRRTSTDNKITIVFSVNRREPLTFRLEVTFQAAYKFCIMHRASSTNAADELQRRRPSAENNLTKKEALKSDESDPRWWSPANIR
jgi:hypothetical protein